MKSPGWPAFFADAGGLFFYFVFRLTVVGGPAFALSRWLPSFKRRRIYRLGLTPGQLTREAVGMVSSMAIDAVLPILAIQTGLLRLNHTPTTRSIALCFGMLFVFMELYFYWSHRVLHWKPLFFIHRRHHEAPVVDPFTSTNFGALERLLLNVGPLAFASVVSWWMPFSISGFASYFLLNYVFGLVLHLNVELFPRGYVKGPIGRVFISSTFHAMHHARYEGHYGLHTPFCDLLFGTLWRDYPEVHDRAASGNGMETLGEVVPASPPGMQASADKRASPQARLG